MIVGICPFSRISRRAANGVRIVEAHIRLAVFRTEDERVANAVRSRCSLLRPPHDEFDHIPLGGLIALSIQGEQYLKLGLFILLKYLIIIGYIRPTGNSTGLSPC